jgi:hypothetical protein
MRRNGIRVKIAAITSILLASMVASVITLGGNYAYALNYRPVEFIKTVDDTTLQFTFALAIDNEGRVIVTDTAAGKVYIIKKEDDGWRLLGSFDRSSAVDLGIDSNGNLVVLTHVHPFSAVYVYKLTYDGSGNLASADIVKQLDGSGTGMFRHPHGLAVHTVDGNDYILIGDNQSRRVQVYDSNLNLLFSFNNAEVYDSSNNKVGDVVNGSSLGNPEPSIHDVKVGKDNTIMVAYKAGIIGIYRIDYVNNEVERVLNIGEHGTALGYFNEPRGVAYDALNDYLIVSDNLNHRIQVFNYSSLHDGVNEPLFYFGSGVAGDGERQLNTPRKILLHDNRLYVADGSNGRIVILELDDMIPNDADKPSIEPLEPSEWYAFSSHRELFQLSARLAYTKMIEQGMDEDVAVRTALEIPAKALEYVLVYIRTLPENARLNIPWASHLKGDALVVRDTPIIFGTPVDRQVVYNAGCTIGKPGSTGISDPREYHAPPVQVGDALYCSTMAIVRSGLEVGIGANSVSAYFIDPDGNERDVYYVDSAGFHTGIRNMSINGNSPFFYLPFAINIDKEGQWKLVNTYSISGREVARIELPFHVGNTYSFNSRAELLDAIRAALSNSGLTNEEVNTIIENIGTEMISVLPESGVIKLQFKKGSVYALGLVMPHDPPLNLNENIQVIVLYASLGSPITINDLHVYAIKPSNIIIPIKDWNWFPGTIPPFFFWISPAVTVDEAGTWQIVSDFTTNDGNTSTVVLSLDATFSVVPESIIGVLGVALGSFAVLAYRLRRIKK